MKSNGWYTPHEYIKAAREVMGRIDLDPASCELANQTVRAARFYSKEENGLMQSWHGNVWLNPPYGRTNNKSNIGAFTAKLLREYDAGNVTQAILLSTCRPDTPWFFRLWEFPICFADHRIYFYVPKLGVVIPQLDTDSGHFHGTLFVYLGSNEQKFSEIFSQFGPVIPANVAVRRQQHINLELWGGVAV